MAGRGNPRRQVVFFVNGGDPTPEISFELLAVLQRRGCVAVELCVPFPDSFTDGPTVRESHRRARAGGATLQSVLALAVRARAELGLHVVLLADHRSTVAPLGMDRFLGAAREAGVAATLVHGLPADERSAYVARSALLGLGRIMTFFVGSDARTRNAAYAEAEGFVYVVSRFGRTGGRDASFGASVLGQIRALRVETTKPLAVGFGVKTPGDVRALHAVGADAVIVGSAATSVIARHLGDPARLLEAFDAFAGAMLEGPPPDGALVSRSSP